MKNTYGINKFLKYLFLCVNIFTYTLFADSINFTLEERNYIQKNKIIKIAMLNNFKPFSFIEKDRHEGLSVDIIKKISIISGLKFDIQTSSWAQALQNFKENKVDMISGISYTKQRENFTLFTEPFYEIPTYIFGLKSNEIYKNNSSLKDKKVGVSHNIFYIDALKMNGIEVLEYAGSKEKAQALAFGEIDYFLANYTTGLKAITTQLLTNIKPLAKYENIKQEDLRYGINKENNLLYSIIKKSLSNIDETDMELLIHKWVLKLGKTEDIVNNLNFTQNEKLFLETNHIIKMCNNPNWEPIEFAQDGDLNNMSGIAIDTMNLLEKKLNVKFENVPTKSWAQSQQYLKEKKCDILPCAAETEERKKYAKFTNPYLVLPLAIITSKDKQIVSGLDEIMDKSLTRHAGSGLISKLQKKYPNMNLIETKSVKESFYYVNNDKAYFTIANLPVASYIISKYLLDNLQISGYTDVLYDLSIAVRDDNKVLLSILNKGLSDISKDQSKGIMQKWVNNSIKEKVMDYSLIFEVLIVVFIITLFIFYRQYILKNQNKKLEILINKKTKDLNELNIDLEEKILDRTKELEIAKQKAEISTKHKSEFLANMSHEIRTPMNGILGMTHLMSKTDLNNTQKKYINKINNSANSLLHIINDILDFSKIEAGQLTIEKINFDLNDMLSNIQSIMELKASEKGLEFNIIVNDDNRIFYGDNLRISQILLNLISNAIKFTDEGKIELVIEKLDNNKIIFSVKDTGIGISKEEQKHLFKSFSQADQSTTRKYGGTGLGLSISKQLAELMNGNVSLKSTVNKGSEFSLEIELPKGKLDQIKELDNIGRLDISILKGNKILLVEDNMINQDIILGVLDGSGIEIDIASNGLQAVEYFNTNFYSLILMDLQMPIMDGYEATSIIRKKDKNIPIIALTANAMKDDILKTQDVGIDEHLTKPIDVNELYATLIKYIPIKE